MSEPSSDPDARVQDQLLHAHEQIYAAVRQLEHARDLVELLESLQHFRRLIVAHFDDEETPGGFFDVVRTRSSRHLEVLERLGKDHGTFLDDLDGAAARARACLAGPVAEILKQGVQLAWRLRDHEARENRLLIDAMYTDSGEGD